METTQDKKGVVERFIKDVWHEGDLDALDDLVYEPSQNRGCSDTQDSASPEEQREFIAMMQAPFPHVHYEYDTDEMIAGEHGVATPWVARSALQSELYRSSACSIILPATLSPHLEGATVVFDENCEWF